MSSSSLASQASSTTDSAVIVVTITVAALTTTFTPPPECTQSHLSQMSSPGYRIWLNEPQPVPGIKNGDCYPSQFIQGYTSIVNASSSIAPMFSPLICPFGWHTAATYASGYIACCASGYQLAPPSTTVDPNRPAYGGTCYSDLTSGSTVTVTAYGTSNVTATAEWVPSSSGAQAYAHPMDGFKAVDVATSGSSTVTATPTSASTLSDSATTSLSGGAIAGIVVGSLVGVALLIIGSLFLFRHRRKNAAGRGTAHSNDGQMTEHGGETGAGGAGAFTGYGSAADKDVPYGGKQLPKLPNSNETWASSPTEVGTSPAEMPGAAHRHELDGGYHAQELDTGYQGTEMRGS